MKKLAALLLSTTLLTACADSAEQAYNDAIDKAMQALDENALQDATTYLEQAVDTASEYSADAELILTQLTMLTNLQNALEQGELQVAQALYATLEQQNLLPAFVEQFATLGEQIAHYEQIATTWTSSLNNASTLAEDGNFIGAYNELKALNLDEAPLELADTIQNKLTEYQAMLEKLKTE